MSEQNYNFHEILPPTLNWNFVKYRGIAAVLSTLGIVLAVALMILVGPNWGIDFTGGTEVQVHMTTKTEVSEVREVLISSGVGDEAIQEVQAPLGSRFVVRVQGKSGTRDDQVTAVKDALIARFGADWIENFKLDAEVGTRAVVNYKGDIVPMEQVVEAVRSVSGVTVQASPEDNTFYLRLPGLAEEIRQLLEATLPDRGVEIEKSDSIGPKVGASLRTAGMISLFVTIGLILVYISFRFDFSFAPGAVLCLFHDSAMVVGLWVITQMEFGLPMISAILTLVGYSINDTIVTYDRIRENRLKYRRKNLPELINDSINQTLARTIVTNGATALALLPFLFLGGPVLKQFAIAMLFGMFVGTYSTIYVAAPVMILLEENKDRLMGLVGLGPKKAA
jgi:preprotein translocase subunit SecF